MGLMLTLVSKGWGKLWNDVCVNSINPVLCYVFMLDTNWSSHTTIVDLLEQVGLNNSSRRDDGSFLIDQPLSSQTDSSEWTSLSSDFPQSFSLYVELNTTDYNGRVVSINHNTINEFSLSLESMDGGSVLELTLVFPQVDNPIVLDIYPEQPLDYQQIGIVLRQTVVSIYLNCACAGSLVLQQLPGELIISGVMPSVVEIFENSSSVRRNVQLSNGGIQTDYMGAP